MNDQKLNALFEIAQIQARQINTIAQALENLNDMLAAPNSMVPTLLEQLKGDNAAVLAAIDSYRAS